MKYKDEIVKIIKKHLPNAKIYLFGSRARKTHHEASDIDLAIDNGEKIALHNIGLIKEQIETSTIPLFVDIIDINATSEEMKNQIFKDGIEW